MLVNCVRSLYYFIGCITICKIAGLGKVGSGWVSAGNVYCLGKCGVQRGLLPLLGFLPNYLHFARPHGLGVLVAYRWVLSLP